MSIFSKLTTRIRRVKKIKTKQNYLYSYPKFFRKEKIKSNVVLIESSHGNQLSGHLYYILEELANNYNHLKLYVAVKNVDNQADFLSHRGINNVKVISYLSDEYCQVLCSAEYLLNDTTFYPFFTKKEGQKYINIWHGTPLKHLGKDMDVLTDMGNVQRNFYMADTIISSNKYTQEILAESHNLNGVYQGKMVIGPSPRNSALFNHTSRTKIRSALGIADKKVIFYMPTWRGTVGKVSKDNKKLFEDLRQISNSLSENEIFYVKLHPFQAEIDLGEFDNIFLMPPSFELYEFLTAVDILITDYSSIMYDFLNTNRKIILYTYDKDEYFNTRGVYENIDDYPFVQVNDVEDLIKEFKKENDHVSYQDMQRRFCPVDNIEGTKDICRYIFKHSLAPTITEVSIFNGKETVAMLSGGFWDNGITTALINTLNNIDTNKRNYLIFFGKSKLKPKHYFRVKNLPENVLFFPVPGTINGTLLDRVILSAYMRYEKFKGLFISGVVERLMKNEFKRIFGDIKIDAFIHYTGFERKYAEMIKHIKAKTIIWVHTDMFKEYEVKKNFSKKVVFYSAYKYASKIVLVSDQLYEKMVKNLPFTKEKLCTIDNFLGEERIQEEARENVFYTLKRTAVDYASNPRDLGTLPIPYLIKNKELFFESDPIYSEYYHLSSDSNLCDLLKEVDVSKQNLLQDTIKKLSLGEELMIKKALGMTKSRLINDLFDPEITVFINIGRYDYQKGHERLIRAFERIYDINENTRLVIVAPHGPLKKDTISWVRNSSAKNGIILLGRMDNPYSLLKLCNAFVLSSYYEGLGLVLYEALAVGTKAVTVDLPQTIQHLKNDEVIIVENSEQGIFNGMKQILDKSFQFKPFDFTYLKEKSLVSFENLFLD
ncbi:CDP-glycerol glycerophosphotransferase family protein [Heyndrickxia acidiproducens]|uniref:CDP-glycerol glycerophosphotransferase family protein n=1 Tax=Heyndrickxia acidiproducens TaxID=1121084 RepID=UPI000367DC07|nr:CDP-glycerol glycerophosphotransferase family protein [Heyndrickxia acidiproducens]